ncbi:hypothetical protein HMPREF0388_1257 [Mobiluncus curtisii ATCC 51333]|jgi:hypothetical protein|uniref:N-acetyltransferase domain-containing protein n=1 Tax=Mobiluncus curtisii ATCC 51333 TaxID=887326 RepID=E6LZH0_9ACTO|nr:hypothetical protein HMPREF0388_1257 [Mobiluncus curtisii ATCC 51333]
MATAPNKRGGDLAQLFAYPASTPGLTWKPLEVTHKPDLMRLIVEMERIDNPPYRTSPAEVDSIFQSEFCGLSAWDQDSRMVAYAIVRIDESDGVQAICSGGVGASWRNRGVGSIIFQWEVQTAHTMLTDKPRPAQIVCFVDQAASGAEPQLRASGFIPAHTYLELRRDLAAPGELVAPGQYLEIIPWSPDFDDHVRRAHNELMALAAGAPAQDMQTWQSSRPFFAPQWSFIALDKSSDVAEIAGYLLSARYEQDWEAMGFTQGYTEILGVLPDYAETQVAAALLSHAIASYQESGMQYAAVGLDQENPTDVAQLYTDFGYEVTGGSTEWVVNLPAETTEPADASALREEVAKMNRESASVLSRRKREKIGRKSQ